MHAKAEPLNSLCGALAARHSYCSRGCHREVASCTVQCQGLSHEAVYCNAALSGIDSWNSLPGRLDAICVLVNVTSTLVVSANTGHTHHSLQSWRPGLQGVCGCSRNSPMALEAVWRQLSSSAMTASMGLSSLPFPLSCSCIAMQL